MSHHDEAENLARARGSWSRTAMLEAWQGRLERLVSRVDARVRVALHGTHGFEPELVRRCVAAGVSRNNVKRLVRDDYFDHLAAHAGRIPHTALMEEGAEKVVAWTAEWIEIYGSAGKA